MEEAETEEAAEVSITHITTLTDGSNKNRGAHCVLCKSRGCSRGMSISYECQAVCATPTPAL